MSAGRTGIQPTTGLTGSAGLSTTFTFVSKTSAYTAVANDCVQADASGAGFTVTLPAAPAAGTVVAIKKVDSSTNAVAVASSALIEGFSSQVIPFQWSGAQFTYSGSTWLMTSIVGTVIPPGPTVRSGSMTYANGSSVNATLPAGTIVGDLLVLIGIQGYGLSAVSGFTSFATNCFWKFATSTDITNGYITVPFFGNYQGQVGIVSVIGANASPIRSNQLASPMATLVTSVSASAQPGDLSIYFTASRNDGVSGMTVSMAKGIAIANRHADTGYSAYLAYSLNTSLTDTNTFTWTARQSGVTSEDAIAVIKA